MLGKRLERLRHARLGQICRRRAKTAGNRPERPGDIARLRIDTFLETDVNGIFDEIKRLGCHRKVEPNLWIRFRKIGEDFGEAHLKEGHGCGRAKLFKHWSFGKKVVTFVEPVAHARQKSFAFARQRRCTRCPMDQPTAEFGLK